MIHYGDITKIKGSEVPIVDIVTGGSPCQDLSVAGKRAGLEGERSGLFMEQIRIIKELRDECIRQLQMRGADVNIRCVRPRYMVWENVPGAFSSNKGEDFRVVLEETARIADKDAVIPGPPKGKWMPSGCIMGDGWSIAWRVHDAQFWGVPQRRKRISLVADFGGTSAPEILFESKSVSGDTAESIEQRQGAAGDTPEGIGETSYTLKIRGGREVDSNGKKAGKGALIQTEMSATLGVSQDQTLITLNEKIEDFVSAVNKDVKHQQDLIQSDLGVARTLAPGTHASGPHLTKTLVTKCLNSWDVQSKHIQPEDGKAEALYSGECRGGGGESYVMQKTICIQGNCIDRADTAGCNGKGWREDQAYTLNTIDHHAVCTGFDSYNLTETGDVGRTLTAAGGGPNEHMPTVCQSLEVYHCQTEEEKTQTLKARDYKDPQCVCYGLDRASFNQGQNAKYDFSVEEEKAQTLVSRGPGGVLADNPKTVGSLCASGYSKLGIQEAMNGMYIVEKKNE